MEIIQSPLHAIIADIVKNNKNLTPALQDAIARFIEIESTPKLSITMDNTIKPFTKPYSGDVVGATKPLQVNSKSHNYTA